MQGANINLSASTLSYHYIKFRFTYKTPIYDMNCVKWKSMIPEKMYTQCIIQLKKYVYLRYKLMFAASKIIL